MFIEEVQKFDKLQTSKTVKLQLQVKMIIMWYSCPSHKYTCIRNFLIIHRMFNMFHQKWLRLNVWALLQTSLDQKGYIMFLLSNVQYNCIRCYMMMLHVPSNAPRSIFLLSHADIHSHVRLDPMGLSWKFHEGSMTETCGSHGVILRML